MPTTPEKKRSGHLVASPEGGISAATKKPSTGGSKRKRKYQFAPVDTLGNRSNDESNVLRAISVSQVRNSTVTKSSRQEKKASESKLRGSAPIAKAKHDARESRVATGGEDGMPSEKVIWQYSPVREEHSDKVGSSYENSEDWMEPDRFEEPSSTPMPRRLKSVLSFANISEREQTDNACPMSVPARISTRSRGTTESLRESLRDIDDILDDMEGELTLKPNVPKMSQIPSSPSRMREQEKGDTADKKSEGDCAYASSDGDDSLINILTEKKSERQNSARPLTDSDLLDDSLVDYFNEINNRKAGECCEDDIGNVEARLSQSLRIPETDSRQEPEAKMDGYIKLAGFPSRRKGVERFVVTKTAEVSLPKIGRQKILSCIDEHGKNTSVIVRHPWIYLEFEEGDVIHIVEGQNFENKKLLSDDKDPTTQLVNDNLLILNPDLLLSATEVGGSVECLRRAVLQSVLEDSRGEPSIAMIVGNIVHELLQSALINMVNNKTLTMDFLEKKLDSLLQTFSFAILLCNASIKTVRKEITEMHLKNIHNLLTRYVKQGNYGCYVSVSGTRKTDPLSIANVIDTEESVWSPIYGLKGFLDVTLDVLCKKTRSIVPLEVKTGKSKSISHEAQGLIYTLLLNDKYEVPFDFFLLLYTRHNEMIKHPYMLHSIKHVLMFRNQMATKLKYRLKEFKKGGPIGDIWPPLLQSSFCDSCHLKAPCMVINNLLEDGTAESSGLKTEDYEYLTNHLVANHSENSRFLKKYNELITQEESSIQFINKSLFLLSSEAHESQGGHCLANLKVVSSTNNPLDNSSFLHVFARTKEGLQSMLYAQLSKNDRVTISDESGHFCITQGVIVDIKADSVTISARRKVLNNRIPAQKSSGLTNIVSAVDDRTSIESLLRIQNMVSYRIDKNEAQQGLALARFSLLNLFLPPVQSGQVIIDEGTNELRSVKRSDGGDARMRAFLVDKVAPRFLTDNESPLIAKARQTLTQFNSDQIKAIENVLRAQDYALILGMPGTGKTTVIAEIIKILVDAGKSILLTSYTHSAVDNVLLKLRATNIKIARLGRKHKILPEVQQYQPNFEAFETYEEYIEEINSLSVVATTCLGISDVLFSLREKDFDYVILDEASQISMPIALAPLRLGEKFIMVGDHHQLPPLVKNEAARVGGLEQSLFKILCDDHPQSVSELTIQYRMCEDIMALSNFLIYQKKLKCGSDQVRDQTFNISSIGKLTRFRTNSNHQPWLEDILDPQRRVIFLNYDNCTDFEETSESDNITNEGEVRIIQQCLKGMAKCGVNPADIGILTLYRAQLHLLKRTFQGPKWANLEILTADQFQGRDKDCIIVSMVRSNTRNNAGSLLKELRRVNVAMTRAKSKLIIAGSKETIGSLPQIRDFINLLKERDWIYDLASNFLQAYNFGDDGESRTDEEYSPKNSQTRTTGARNLSSQSRIFKDTPIVRQAISEI
ncbi:hypothetical protein HG536_0A00970 [Torulaspora globosa]|uniref:DNA replication ATP-dependent helicase/nuclease DNA2 n=1 Tax=Torulaspora globosa TaxID=48254 RepID=A0A7G3Z9U4_9SACH|nr:uncharacterized protein HG536_0A00970 [Torulaspora globosa]QLL30280.1 hypothetical protein HG536_0A00970 [Torulaspora globosa]